MANCTNMDSIQAAVETDNSYKINCENSLIKLAEDVHKEADIMNIQELPEMSQSFENIALNRSRDNQNISAVYCPSMYEVSDNRQAYYFVTESTSNYVMAETVPGEVQADALSETVIVGSTPYVDVEVRNISSFTDLEHAPQLQNNVGPKINVLNVAENKLMTASNMRPTALRKPAETMSGVEMTTCVDNDWFRLNCCVEDQYSKSPNNYKCGGCSVMFETVCKLHFHLQLHPEGGSYHYDHILKTAFPKYDSNCMQTQTDNVQVPEVGDSIMTTGNGATDLQTRQISIIDSATHHQTPQLPIDESALNLLTHQALLNDNTTGLQTHQVSGSGDAADIQTSELPTMNIALQSQAHHIFISDNTVGLQTQHISDLSSNSVVVSNSQSIYAGNSETNEMNEVVEETTLRSVNVSDIEREFNHIRDDVNYFDSTNSKIIESLPNIDHQPSEKDQPSSPLEHDHAMYTTKRIKRSSRIKHRMRNKYSRNADYHSDADADTHHDDKHTVYITVRPNTPNIQNLATEKSVNPVQVSVDNNALDDIKNETDATSESETESVSTKFESGNDEIKLSQEIVSEIKPEDSNVDIKEKHYFCKYCESVFSSRSDKQKHVKEVHAALDMDQGEKSTILECVPCNKTYATNGGLQFHKISKHSGIEFICDICDAKLGNASSLKQHQIEQHFIKITGHYCEPCKRQFTQACQLREHMKTVHGKFRNQTYICEICGYQTDLQTNLSYHKRRYHRGKIFKCEFCEFSSASSGPMTRHKKMHLGLRDYVCDYCGQTFLDKGTLVKHIRTHTGEKPYQCTQCPKAFATITPYERHLKMHSNTKNYKCDFCDKTFVQKANCVAHMRQHTGEKPYKCDTCGTGFTHNVSRKNHMLKRHGIHMDSRNIVAKAESAVQTA